MIAYAWLAQSTQILDEPLDPITPTVIPRRTCQQCGRLYHRLLGDATRCGLCLSAGVVAPIDAKPPPPPSICLDCHQHATRLTYDRCGACLREWRAHLDTSRYAEPRPKGGRPPKGGNYPKQTHRIAPCVVCGRVLPIRGRERCGRDYVFLSRHGHDRPPVEATG